MYRHGVPMLEALTIYVGAATAKAVAKGWFKDEVLLESASESLIDLISAKIPGFKEKRRASALFESVADEVAHKLEPFYETEFSQLSEPDREAVAIAVARTIDQGSLSLDLLLSNNLQAVEIERHLRQQDPDATRDFEEAGTSLYAVTLKECCNYIAQLSASLPNFTSASTAELLKRDDELIDLVRKVLRNLPAFGASLSGISSDVVRFEDTYRKEAARVLDRLRLFGLGNDEMSQRYQLSVAYITLSASTATMDETSPGKGAADDGSDSVGDEDAEEHYARIDEVIGDAKRLVIGGEAGSGKTTLLQWLAVNSAKSSFDDALSDLNDTVPFFVRLRRYVGEDLPTPDRFLESVSPQLVTMTPTGWVERSLETGRALVLIDGVDELPLGQRDAAREWLEGLCSVFPTSRFIVTSRPPAIENDWLADVNFTRSDLQPMDVDDVDSFVTHWHSAAAEEIVDDDDRQELVLHQERLIREVRKSPSIRALASSPLLCAVLCTLNLSRRARLPSDRIELYGLAIDLLLEARDAARDVSEASLGHLRLRQKQALVRDLAYWLILNGESDVPRERAIAVLNRRLGTLGTTDLDADAVFDHLLLRSGLLRQPTAGRIDFIHRTFQEYLGAEEALDQDHVGVLVDHGTDDDWREVIVLAAGLATSEQRDRLLTGLLQKGSSDAAHRHRLHLLAVACLETSPSLSPGVRAAVGKSLSSVMPPTTLTEARAVASAGPLAVPLLAGFHAEKAPIARACVRALGLIGTDDAMTALEPFGPDTRVTVTRELLRSWPYFDPEEFGRRVLAASPLEDGGLIIRHARFIPAVTHLQRLKKLQVFLGGEVDLAELASINQLVRLSLRGNDHLETLDALAGHCGLRSLSLHRCSSLKDITAISDIELHRLVLEGNPALTSLEPLLAHPTLESLDIGGQDTSGLARVLPSVPTLTRLRLTGLASVDGLGLPSAQQIEHLTLTQIGNVDWAEIAAMRGVEALTVNFCERVTGAHPVTMPRLSRVTLNGSPVTTLAPFSGCSEISTLTAIGCLDLADISALEGLDKLARLDLEGCERVTDLSAVAGSTSLSWIDIMGSGIVDLEPLKGVPTLRVLRAWDADPEMLGDFAAARPDVNILGTVHRQSR